VWIRVAHFGHPSVKRQLDPAGRSIESRDFEAGLRQKIVRQDEAVQAVVDLYQVFRTGLNSPGRPVGNLVFLGPTGAGKTRVVEATGEVLFGDPRARQVREGGALGVVLVDLDHFQYVQDTYGHVAGGEVLREAAQRMMGCVLPYDSVGRYGGEEFLIVGPLLPTRWARWDWRKECGTRWKPSR
jgi:hypothetical protein